MTARSWPPYVVNRSHFGILSGDPGGTGPAATHSAACTPDVLAEDALGQVIAWPARLARSRRVPDGSERGAVVKSNSMRSLSINRLSEPKSGPAARGLQAG
jgi:hypothetical protein